ncbi:DUF1353 domain-containing protein [Microbacteriaceae bacterium VKM Ac-2854]|nr:DUF1353 domain-containing protein [Microbacteriaceae bacterium VKM Ac-2854]
MPFLTLDGSPLTRVGLEQVLAPAASGAAGLFVLTSGFVYLDPFSGERVEVPANPEPGDLASVPSFLWGLLAPFGRQTAPALMHDHLRRRLAAAPPTRRAALARQADRLFRSALLDSGVSIPRAWLMWAGVSLTRDEDIAPTASRLRVLHALVIAIILWLSAVRSVRGSARPADAARAIAAVASAALQSDRARATLIVAAVVAPLVPLLAISWLTGQTFRVVETVLWLVLRRRGPRPDGRPTLAAR